jgi:excisionase family DNA binding protein
MTAHPKSETAAPQYLSIAEAAALYHVSRDFLRDRIIDGSLPAVRSGKKIIRIGSGDLERLFRPVQSMRRLQ